MLKNDNAVVCTVYGSKLVDDFISYDLTVQLHCLHDAYIIYCRRPMVLNDVIFFRIKSLSFQECLGRFAHLPMCSIQFKLVQMYIYRCIYIYITILCTFY